MRHSACGSRLAASHPAGSIGHGNPRRLGPLGWAASMGHADIALIGSALVAQTLKEIGIPSPGVTQGALVYAGYQLAGGHVLIGSLVITAIFAGSLGGALVAYAIGRSLGSGLVNRPGRYLRLSPRSLERARHSLGTGALWAVTVGRMVPAIMAPLSVVAGMVRVRVAVFASGVSLSTLAWAGLLAGLGAVCGRALGDVALPANVPFLAAVSAGTILVASIAYLWWRSTPDVEGRSLDLR